MNILFAFKDGKIDGVQRLVNHFSMADRQQLWIQLADFPSAFEGNPLVPGGKRRKWKQGLECPGYGNAAMCLKSVSGKEGVIARVQ